MFCWVRTFRDETWNCSQKKKRTLHSGREVAWEFHTTPVPVTSVTITWWSNEDRKRKLISRKLLPFSYELYNLISSDGPVCSMRWATYRMDDRTLSRSYSEPISNVTSVLQRPPTLPRLPVPLMNAQLSFGRPVPAHVGKLVAVLLLLKTWLMPWVLN